MSVILSTLSMGFDKIQSLDVRVLDVVLTPKVWEKLKTDHMVDPVHTPTTQQTGFSHTHQEVPTGCGPEVGALWGATVHLGDKVEFFGEHNIVPLVAGQDYSEDIWRSNMNRHDISVRCGRLVATAPWRSYNGIPYVFVKSHSKAISSVQPEERNALGTLREMISEADFRRYLKNGFLNVTGQSGRVYQIYADHRHVKVWEKSILVEEICSYIKSPEVPPTDKVIAFMIMVRSDEEELRKIGNVYNFRGRAA